MESVSEIQPIVNRSLLIFSGRVMDIPLGLLRGSLGKAESVIVWTFLFIVTMPLRHREAFTDEYLTNVKFLPQQEGSKRSATPNDSGNLLPPSSMYITSQSAAASSATTTGPLRGAFRAAFDAAANSRARLFASPSSFGPSTQAFLTPLDEVLEISSITPKKFEALKKREVARCEKLCADLALMVGSPLDAYIRYNRAAELTKAAQDHQNWT
jgi:hypothetical protein